VRTMRSPSDRSGGPWRLRRFSRWVDTKFLPILVVLWFGGLGAMLLASTLSDDGGESANHIALLTIWPALVAWFGVSGIAILWKLRLLSNRAKQSSYIGRAFFAVLFLTGLFFVAAALYILVVVARGLSGA